MEAPMPEYLPPGVYVEEMSIQPKPIEGVPTSTAGFIGPCHKGPIKRATLVTSLAEFERTYGSGRRRRLDDGALSPNYTWHAVRAFFKEGGRRLYIARVPRWKARDCQKALKCFEATEEISIDKGTQWAVFEPNGEPLWAKIRRAVEDFLTNEWRSGSLPGSRPEEAFFVKCDRSTMTQADIDQGRLICVAGVAVVRPAEFVIFRIGQWTADRPPSHHKRRRRSVRRGAR
jgi:phage tail sheath protein FI